ncbi:hypothetical protein NQ317_009047 [Molorchus minor]|uniref:Uncharacterized protein n=1 Tax=Molorchus minor TaxID=1323400 RepID=A0ABQ9JBQ3_9CUCU|nr:hypothetical protein NQ317_009047 [Molorchus minor]
MHKAPFWGLSHQPEDSAIFVQGNDFDYSRNDPSPPVRGIDCDYSRNDPSTPDFSRTLPKARNTVFGTRNRLFPKRYENSQTWQLPPFFPNRQTSDRLSASKIFSKREDAWPQATPLAAKLPPGQRSCPRGGAAAPASLAELGN